MRFIVCIILCIVIIILPHPISIERRDVWICYSFGRFGNIIIIIIVEISMV
jgi:hypothetical protein